MKTAFHLLQNPRTNKSTAFTREERDKYGLNGLLPSVIETLDTQVLRTTAQVDEFEKPINKYIYLMQSAQKSVPIPPSAGSLHVSDPALTTVSD